MKIKSLVIAVSMFSAVSTAVAADAMTDQASNDAAAMAMTQMNQLDGFISSAGPDWTNYVTINGGLFVDGHFGNLGDQLAIGTDANRESVAAGYLAVEATPNDWATFNTVVNYTNSDVDYAAGQETGTFIDQAYLTIADFNKYPVYFQAGQQYIPFGTYDLYPINKPFTQLLSQTNATDAQLGFVTPQGLYGAVYTFQGTATDVDDNGDKTDTYGATVGFQKDNDKMSFNAVLGYLDNFQEVTLISDELGGTYADKVGAYSLHLNFNTGPFGLSGDYVTAADTTTDIQSVNGVSQQPNAYGLRASYDFAVKGVDSQVVLGYQESSDAASLNFAETRYVADINLFPWDNTMVGFEITSDSNYDSGSAPVLNGEDFYTYGLRVGVQF